MSLPISFNTNVASFAVPNFLHFINIWIALVQQYELLSRGLILLVYITLKLGPGETATGTEGDLEGEVVRKRKIKGGEGGRWERPEGI